MDQLANAGVSIGSSIAPAFLAKIKKHIGYLIKYKDNLTNLKAARDQLDAKRSDASRFLDDTHCKLKDVSSTASLWRTHADELYDKAQKTISQNNVSCVNLLLLYLLSKHAWELTQMINQTVEKAPDFGTTFDRSAQELGATFNLKGYMEFESRVRILNDMLKALEDEEVTMCSLCGMGGTGKTTLAKKLIQRVEAERLFGKVAMVTVSQSPKLDKIQQEIIEQVGLKMDEETTTARAKKLYTWLANNNTLLILDDVWWELSHEDFENVGIPLRSTMCKIVLTSRNEEECKKTGSQRYFSISVLEREEAWELFRLIGGKCTEDLSLKDTARRIADECNGLPIAIVAISVALKDNPVSVWNDSLRHLQNSNLQRISGMEKVYSRIQLSYDLLKDKEAQSCFRLCCLFPEDSDVSVDSLVFFGKGLELFKDVDTIMAARDRAEAIIYKLKKSFLLIDGEKDGCARMHDIMRDFAISFSSDPYLVIHGKEMKKWPETHIYENCSAISFMHDTIMEHPVDLRCPKLKVLNLWLEDDSARLPVSIFDGMKELKALILCIPLILQPLSMLKELRALVVIENTIKWDGPQALHIEDVIGHGDLKYLEILGIHLERPIHNFPMEIGLLCNLRILSIMADWMRYIPPGVISKLVKLEELSLPQDFMSWGYEDDYEDEERVNASLDEIESLPITSLNIGIDEGSSLGEKFTENLKMFNLLVGSIVYTSKSFTAIDQTNIATILGLTDVDASVLTESWIVSLLKKTECLKLKNVGNLKNLMHLSRLVQPKTREIERCEEMDCLINKTMQAPGFINLSHIKISGCSKLQYVFPISVAGELRQLQSIHAQSCGELMEIFRDDGDKIVEENAQRDRVDATVTKTAFPQLKEVWLTSNPRLRVFYGGNESVELPLLERIEIAHCRNMEAFSYGSLNAPKLKEVLLDDIDHYKSGVEDANAFWKGKEVCK